MYRQTCRGRFLVQGLRSDPPHNPVQPTPREGARSVLTTHYMLLHPGKHKSSVPSPHNRDGGRVAARAPAGRARARILRRWRWWRRWRRRRRRRRWRLLLTIFRPRLPSPCSQRTVSSPCGRGPGLSAPKMDDDVHDTETKAHGWHHSLSSSPSRCVGRECGGHCKSLQVSMAKLVVDLCMTYM